MRSLWTITYAGSHTATTVKKLTRLLSVTAEDIQRERYVLNDERIERAAFLVDHGDIEWAAMLVELLQKTARVAYRWQCNGDATTVLSGSVTRDDLATEFHQGLPAGLKEIGWVVRTSQLYPDALLSADSSIDRW